MTDNIARLLALMGGSGGSGGTTDYNDLINKPTIGGTTLSGDLTLADLGYIVDNIINAESTNPVQNAVIAAALSNLSYNNLSNKPSINNVTLTGNTTLKQLGLNAIWVGTSAEFEIDKDTIANGTLIFITDNDIVDSVPAQNSTNLVESGGVYSFVMGGLSDKVDKVNGKGLSTEDYTTAEKTKLAGIEDEATRTWVGTSAEYMQQASSIPAGTPIIITDDVDTDATPTQNSINPVQSGGVYDALANKVDKVSGKGLSTEDYTTAEKTKLGGIEAEANKTVVDSALSGSSTNPVQNKVVTDKFTEIENSHIELTQAEYDALGNEKYLDNKEYFITDAAPDDPTYIYGFHIDPDESDSYDCVTYLADAIGMTPAAMGTTAFNYGSWENAFFMPKPCMLKFDGTVDYYLDPNDYTKKADGTASDIADLSYGGNAMMEFPLIWYKFEQGIANGEGYFYVSNKKVDNTYKCWSNMDCDGNIIDHFYMPIYNGVTYDEKMRSISGITLAPWSTTAYSAEATYAVGDKVNYNGRMWKCTTAIETAEAFDPEKWEQFAFNGNTTGTEEITQAMANNTTEKTEWYIDQWCDRVLINGLLMLISKSIDTQGAFGRGIDTGSQAAKESYVTGSLNDKGLFYGSTANGATAVKVFGMENWWALVWRRTAGLIGGANNSYLYKLTASTADGSTVSAYNTNGSGYLSTNGKPASSNYVKQMKFGAWGWLPFEVGAYSTQYYKDCYYNGTGFALVGGISGSGARCGAFCVALSDAVSGRGWLAGAAPSCKPCASNQS